VKRVHGYKDVPPEYITRHTQEARPYSTKRKVMQRRGSSISSVQPDSPKSAEEVLSQDLLPARD